MEKINVEKINWEEINRKISEIQKIIKDCEFVFLQAGEDWTEAQVSQYGRVNNGYDTENGWRDTDWFLEFHTYADKTFLEKHIHDKVSLDYSEDDKELEKFDTDCSVDIFDNDNFSDCWLRYYIGVPGEVSLEIMESHINANEDVIIGRLMF